MGCIQKKGDTVQPQSQGQIPTGAALLNDGKYGLNKEKDRAQLEQERQHIQAGRFFQNASTNSSTTPSTYSPYRM